MVIWKSQELKVHVDGIKRAGCAGEMQAACDTGCLDAHWIWLQARRAVWDQPAGW